MTTVKSNYQQHQHQFSKPQSSSVAYCLWLGLLLIVSSFDSHGKPDKVVSQQQLNKLEQQIERSQQQIANKKEKQSFLTNLLKKSELSIAEVARQLNQTQQQQKQQQQALTELKQQQHQLQTQQQRQQQQLSQQLKSLYVNGDSDYAKLLLNQQDPAQLERMLGYYQYLNRARISNLDQIKQTLAQLTQVNQQLEATLAQLAQLKQQQQQRQQQLRQHQQKRKQTLAQLQSQLTNQGQQLQQLKHNRSELSAALEKLKHSQPAHITLNGLKHLKGKLNWPIDGKLRNRFGRQRTGSLRWKGVTLQARSGAPVKTIERGLVLFADWLKGFGWVIVIDHGNGYMSLYGHNQTLLRTVGERVETGEPIALVGNSGGQAKSGLYFEIRYQGDAINPAKWCKRKS